MDNSERAAAWAAANDQGKEEILRKEMLRKEMLLPQATEPAPATTVTRRPQVASHLPPLGDGRGCACGCHW